MNLNLTISMLAAGCLLAGCAAPAGTRDADREKTAFQTNSPWKDVTDNRADVAGIAWGSYQDYFTGEWDGVNHLDEGQVVQAGDTLWHGHMVPYLVPTESFIAYMQQVHIRRVIDAGIDAIYLEEPEFWARAGYSEAFKREWKKYYGFDWRPQHESAENTYLSNKLKYHLYYNALDKVFTFAK